MKPFEATRQTDEPIAMFQYEISPQSTRGQLQSGITALATGSHIRETLSPNKKICTSWPASARALPCRNGKAAFVGSSEPQALLTNTFMAFSFLKIVPSCLSRLGFNRNTGIGHVSINFHLHRNHFFHEHVLQVCYTRRII